jgi:DNA sulfur modification protein DndD
MFTTINSISLSNFYNYYGSYQRNTYNFDVGLNVIVGKNNAGKSKLFNAFQWILNDQVFDSDYKRYYPIRDKEVQVRMISDKAKAETSQGEELECSVCISFSENRFDYTVEKSIKAEKLQDENPTDPVSWQTTLQEPNVYRRDRYHSEFRPINEINEKNDIIKKIIRPDFQQYALLKGEEVESIIDFSNKDNLNVVSRMKGNMKESLRKTKINEKEEKKNWQEPKESEMII